MFSPAHTRVCLPPNLHGADNPATPEGTRNNHILLDFHHPLRHSTLAKRVLCSNVACLPKRRGLVATADFSSHPARRVWHPERRHTMTKALHTNGRPVWAEISLKAILHNLQVIRRHTGGKRMVLAVVKSNAYGLGAVPISKALQKAGTEWFGVTCANEGIELREAGIRKRILVLTGFWPGEEKRLLANRLTPTVTRVSDVAHLERAAKSARGKSGRVPFHLKINTGMNRLGIMPSELDAFAAALADAPPRARGHLHAFRFRRRFPRAADHRPGSALPRMSRAPARAENLAGRSPHGQ